jgi:nitroreductase
MFTTDHKEIKKAVIRSQHCQRNFDLSKTIPDEDLELLIHAATNCPSKQNLSFYRLHIIKDRDLISKIHELSTGVTANNIITGEREIETTNSQVLANVLFVFERKELYEMSEKALEKWARADEAEYETFKRDLNVAIGIASGYVNFAASLLGYATGCCQCFQKDEIGKLLGLEKGPELIMGVGYNDDSRNRRIHATDSSLMFPTRKKEEIEVKVF